MAGPSQRRNSASERDPLIDAEYGATNDSNNPDAREFGQREGGSSRKLVTAVAALLALGVGVGGTLVVLQMIDKLPRGGDAGTAPIPVPPSQIEVPPSNDGKIKKRRNVIMMVSDGFGATSETFGRTMYHVLGLDKNATRGATVYGSASSAPGDWWGPKTPLDDILVGQSRTKSSSSWVTDSAAGATAFSCASKSYNGAIGVTADGAPCGTAFEAAKLKGYKTGLIVTSRITHATPASFNSHVLWRDYENDIAEQQIGDLPILGRTADLQFGGGRRHFVPQGHPESVREDARDLLAEARSQGFTVATTRAEFDAIRTAGPKGGSRKLPILGLFSPDHMPYNIDRDPAQQPSLEEMADTGLRLLRAASHDDDRSPGFFALVEGSRIDMAGHSNDPATHAHEILHYYRVVAAVRKFVDECNAAGEETIMVSTSDHETGGLALARQVSAKYPEYQWYPEVLLKQKQSTVSLANELVARRASSPNMAATIRTLAAERLGVSDLSIEELAFLSDPLKTATDLDYALGTVVSVRAQLGWSTHGHSGADVNLYAHGHSADKLRGSWENTDVGMFLQRYIGVERDVPLITAALRKQLKYKHPTIPPPKDGPGLMATGGSEAAARVNAYGHD